MNPPPNDHQSLRLAPAPPADGARVAARFLSGGKPADWLAEICAWGLGAAQAELRLHVLPRSAADRRPAGALAVWPEGCPAPASARAQPYRALLGRLYLPLDARLEPPVSDDELDRLCRREDTFVFHPGAGLCAFRAGEALRVADLILAPARASQGWAGAHPGLAPAVPLRSVRLEMPTDLPSLFGEAAREIGVDAGQPEETPPAPDGAAGPMTGAARKMQEWLASVALGFTGFLPRTAAPTWFNRLENWAKGRLAPPPTEDLDAQRNRELQRLLDLLQNDPDAGLRRALPLAGLGQRRGRARPAGRLGQRDPNFRLGALAGGKPADAWAVPPDVQNRLRERYRELANEETRLGRHRRAAYIHAELLGDLSSAAACLKQGRHFHEAAVLYRDHLRRPLEAADCLAAGGELAEAVAIYEREKRFLQAADLYEKMGDAASAAAAYRREADRLAAADDLLAAAALLETKLAAPDEAVALLRRGWPDSKQAGRCLARAFESLGARGAHAQAGELLAGLADETLAPAHTLPLASQLAAAQETYPDEAVRHRARELARVRVAGRLPAAGSPEVRGLVEILGRLAPGDRLLTRDGSRYLAGRQEQEKRRALAAPPAPPLTARAPTAPVSSRRTVRQGGLFQLHAGTRWRQFRASGSGLLAAGYTRERQEVKLVRAAWDGLQQAVVWPVLNPEEWGNGRRPLLLEAPRDGAGFVVCAFAASASGGNLALNPRQFFLADRAGWQPAECGQPTWWPDAVLAATYAADGNLWLVGATDAAIELILTCHAPHGGIVSQITLSLGEETAMVACWSGTAEVHLTSVGSCLLLACSNRLFIRQGTEPWKELAFDSPVTGLAPTPALARAGCAVMLEDGVALVWLDRPPAAQTVATDLPRPLAAFTRQGTLVTLSRDIGAGRLFEIIRGEARPAADFKAAGSKPVALLGTGEREGFAVADEDGTVRLYTS